MICIQHGCGCTFSGSNTAPVVFHGQDLTTATGEDRCPYCGRTYPIVPTMTYHPEEEEEKPREPKPWDREKVPVVPRFKRLDLSRFRPMQQRARDGLR